MGKKTDQISQLKKRAIILLYQDNPKLSLTTIGEVFDCSRAYVSAVLRAAGFTNEADEKEIDVKAQLDTLVSAYGSVQQVAALLDMSESQIWRLRNRKSKARRELAAKIGELLKH